MKKNDIKMDLSLFLKEPNVPFCEGEIVRGSNKPLKFTKSHSSEDKQLASSLGYTYGTTMTRAWTKR